MKVQPWLAMDGSVALSRARFSDADAAGNHIPGAPARVVGAGLSIDGWRDASGSVRLRHFGARALAESGAIRSSSTTLVNLEGGADALLRSSPFCRHFVVAKRL